MMFHTHARLIVRTHGRVCKVEVQQVFILDLRDLNDGFVVKALLVGLHLGPHQLVLLV